MPVTCDSGTPSDATAARPLANNHTSYPGRISSSDQIASVLVYKACYELGKRYCWLEFSGEVEGLMTGFSTGR